VTPRTCPRCHSTLHTEDANSLVFCWNCGAPQVTLSEELQDQFAQQKLAAEQSGGHPAFTPEPAADPSAVLWPLVLQLAGLAGVVIFALSLITAAFPPFALVEFLWIVGAPIILLGIYCARKPLTRITTSFGAKLGLLSGLAIGIAIGVTQTIGFLLARFAFHQGAELDANFATAFANVRAQTLANSTGATDTAALQQIMDKLSIPEFRVGLLLAGSLLFLCLYLLYASLAGAFAGYLRSRAARR
jgi:hypothetical protein